MKNYLKNSIKILISGLILYFLLREVGLKNLAEIIIETNLLILVLILPLKIISFFLNALNIKIFLDGIGQRISYWKLFSFSNLAWSLGLFFPGRIGELSLIYFLKEENVTFGEGGAVAILDKISTFILLSVFSVLAILKYFDFEIALKFGVTALCVLIGSILALSNEKIRFWVKKYLLRSYSVLFTGFNSTFRQILFQNKKLFFYNLLVTAIKWLTSFLVIQIIFYSLGYPVNLIDVSYITSLSMLISLIPISIGGLGIRESAAVYLFSIINVKPEISLTAYLINTILNYLAGSVFVLFNIKRISYNKERFVRSSSDNLPKQKFD